MKKNNVQLTFTIRLTGLRLVLLGLHLATHSESSN